MKATPTGSVCLMPKLHRDPIYLFIFQNQPKTKLLLHPSSPQGWSMYLGCHRVVDRLRKVLITWTIRGEVLSLFGYRGLFRRDL